MSTYKLKRNSNEQNDDENIDVDYQFTVLTSEELIASMNATVANVIDIIDLPPTTIRILLGHYKWNQTEMINRYYASNDLNNFLEEAKVANPFMQAETPPREILDDYECQICFTDCRISDMTALECGDLFCNNCWVSHITVKILEEGMGERIPCPASKCNAFLEDETCLGFVENSKAGTIYEKMMLNRFVESNPYMVWCPNSECGNAIQSDFVDAKPVVCSCGKIFCFSCTQYFHSLVACDYLSKWLETLTEDKETEKYLLKNTNECPKCRRKIERNGGCNHMTCNNVKCKFEFCWLCLSQWDGHDDFFNCNRPDQELFDRKDVSLHMLNWYTFCLEGYHSTCNSLKSEMVISSDIIIARNKLSKQGITQMEMAIFEEARTVLKRCRESLRDLYVFIYYQYAGIELSILVGNIEVFRRATEDLSWYLGDLAEIEKQDFSHKYVDLQDQIRLCRDSRDELEKHVHECNTNDSWEIYKIPV